MHLEASPSCDFPYVLKVFQDSTCSNTTVDASTFESHDSVRCRNKSKVDMLSVLFE